ncbi:hypothetical protein Bcell_2894 [Evansella cellulosilytica DSM 2522]|uniref:Uncharacterized protein n=2 Tax=Evansella TaxID=2837485 RepID=E6TX56_EVAC2|nr:hypothetical protein Bcell_2894 [Evansella cellulosilytica DSM 2522]
MKSWTVEEIFLNEDQGEALVKAEEPLSYIKQLKAGEQILVDSDAKAFVYILEDNEGYVHIRFPLAVWSELEVMKTNGLPMFVVFSHKEENIIIQLNNFLEELNTLLENIKDNSNYGKDFVLSVENAFHL